MSQTKAQLLGPVVGDVNYDSGTLFVDSTNNKVGIGLTNPQNLLHIKSGTSGASSYDSRYKLILENSGEQYIGFYNNDNSYSGIRFNNTTTILGNIDYYYTQNYLEFYSNGGHVFKTPQGGSNAERLRIKSDGNVGIGTTNPQSKLHLYGTDVTQLIQDASGIIKIVTSGGINYIQSAATPTTGSSADLRFTSYNASSTYATISSTGNVGIGTDNPGSFSSGAYNLVISSPSGSNSGITINSDPAGTDIGSIFFSHGTSANAQGRIRYDHSNDSMQFYTNGSTERLRINSAGNFILQGGTIFGDDTATNTLTIQSTSGNNNHSKILIGINEGSDNGGIHMYTAGPSVAERRITIKGTSGNVGIGTTNPGDSRLFINNTFNSTYSGSAYNDDFLLIKNESTIASTAASIYMVAPGDGNSAAVGAINLIHTGNGSGDLSFQTRYNGGMYERLRIATNGNVGIGTESSHAKLEVSGGQNQTANQFTDLVSISANANNDSINAEVQLNFGISPSHTAEANRKARIQSITHAGNATPLVINPAGGNIGIGTDNPNGALHVRGSSSSTSTMDSPLYLDVAHNTISMFVGRFVSTSGFGSNTYSGTIRYNGSDVAWGDISYYPTGDSSAGSFRFTRNGSTVSTTPNARIGVGGIWMPGTGKITLNNGDVDIEGQSSYHLRIRTYDGSSSMRQIMKFQGGTAGGHVTIGGDANGPSNGFVPLHFASSKTIGSGYTQGGSTLFIGQIAPGNSGETYLHVKFDVPTGAMFYLRSWGYVYGYAQVYNSWCGGYLYGTSVINTQTYNSNSNYGITNVYYTSDGNVALRLTLNQPTGNAWGYSAFEGGFDPITGALVDDAIKILAYTWTSSSANQY